MKRITLLNRINYIHDYKFTSGYQKIKERLDNNSDITNDVLYAIIDAGYGQAFFEKKYKSCQKLKIEQLGDCIVGISCKNNKNENIKYSLFFVVL